LKHNRKKKRIPRRGEPELRVSVVNPGANEKIEALKTKLRKGKISPAEFRRLLKLEEMKTEYAARVQLRSIARDLLPRAAGQARAGRSRLLSTLANILLKSEITTLRQTPSEESYAPQVILQTSAPRPPQDLDERNRQRAIDLEREKADRDRRDAEKAREETAKLLNQISQASAAAATRMTPHTNPFGPYRLSEIKKKKTRAPSSNRRYQLASARRGR
jgi:hypothetical protein